MDELSVTVVLGAGHCSALASHPKRSSTLVQGKERKVINALQILMILHCLCLKSYMDPTF